MVEMKCATSDVGDSCEPASAAPCGAMLRRAPAALRPWAGAIPVSLSLLCHGLVCTPAAAAAGDGLPRFHVDVGNARRVDCVYNPITLPTPQLRCDRYATRPARRQELTVEIVNGKASRVRHPGDATGDPIGSALRVGHPRRFGIVLCRASHRGIRCIDRDTKGGFVLTATRLRIIGEPVGHSVTRCSHSFAYGDIFVTAARNMSCAAAVGEQRTTESGSAASLRRTKHGFHCRPLDANHMHWRCVRGDQAYRWEFGR